MRRRTRQRKEMGSDIDKAAQDAAEERKRRAAELKAKAKAYR